MTYKNMASLKTKALKFFLDVLIGEISEMIVVFIIGTAFPPSLVSVFAVLLVKIIWMYFRHRRKHNLSA